MRKTQLESHVQREAQKVFEDHGAFVFKTHGDIYTRVGIPDLVACVPVTFKQLREMVERLPSCVDKDEVPIGLFVAAEMKRKGHLRDVSQAQFVVGSEITNAGGHWGAYDSAETLDEALNHLQKSPSKAPDTYEQLTIEGLFG